MAEHAFGQAVQDAPARLSQEATEALNRLQAEIEEHRKQDRERSYLGKAFDFIYRSDERSLGDLQRLQNQTNKLLQNGDLQGVEALTGQIDSQIQRDRKLLNRQGDISFYGSTGLKIGAILVSGPYGWAATAALYMADQARPEDRWQTQLVDAGLGLGKGLLFKGLVTGAMGSQAHFALKGSAMSLGGRGLETLLTRESYLDGAGNLSAQAFWNTAGETFPWSNLAADAAIMGLAYAGGYGLGKALGPAAMRSPFLSRVASSGVAGMSSGAVSEISMARAAGEAVSLRRIGQRALVSGAVYSLAAVPGAVQAEVAFREAAQDMSKRTDTAVVAEGTDRDVKEYRRVGSVRAERLASAQEWRTGNGDVMRAEAGDWKLTGTDGSVWSVKPDIFQQTYAPVPGSPGEYAKTAITRASRLLRPTTIQTLEGTGSGNAGDYLVTGPKGEQYIVAKETFESRYVPIDR